MNTRNYATGRPTVKFDTRWEGPFEVLKVSLYAITLKLPTNIKIYNTFYVTIVRPY